MNEGKIWLEYNFYKQTVLPLEKCNSDAVGILGCGIDLAKPKSKAPYC